MINSEMTHRTPNNLSVLTYAHMKPSSTQLEALLFVFSLQMELENARLRDTLSKALETPGCASALPFQSALEDEAVLQSIESSFTKFHAFLDLLRDAGYFKSWPS